MSFFSNLSSLFGSADQQKGPGTAVSKAGKQSAKKPKPGFQKKSSKQHQVASSPKPQIQHVQHQPPVSKVDLDSELREARAKAREIIVEAKDEALAIRSQAEKKSRDVEKQLVDQQQFLQKKLDSLDSRLSQIASKEDHLDSEKEKIELGRKQLEETKAKVLSRLEEISGQTKAEATKTLLEGLEKKLSKEMSMVIRQRLEEAKQEADEKVKEILIEAMRHGATDHVAEYTVSVLELPSEDVKGKIIGRSGRNIHTFERVTGVDIDLDASPTEVKLSCFDPVRREIARVAMQRLIKDGRIQPTRIEEVVDKAKQEVEKLMLEAGKQLCNTVGVYNLPTGLVQMLGRFKYRFSYGQSMITHTIEETKIGIKLAKELGVDANVVRLGCLLHDLGKVSEDPEGSHVDLGVKMAKKFGMPKSVLDCIEQHHEDKPFSGPEQMVVYVADAISGARPGARYDNLEEYVERLENLEKIATSYDGVESAYAIQAGRELRVLLKPEATKDDDVMVLSLKIKDEIEEKLTYPGTVKVTVIRELRGEGIAK